MAESEPQGIKLTDDGGVVKEVLVEGAGDSPPNGVEVSVHYVGTLLDGTKFDSSRDHDQFFTFPLGAGRVIKGWDVGVKSMKRGEKCVLTCAPEYAYGEGGSPPKIPGNATLKFEVELFDWAEEKLTNDGFITKVKVFNEGEGAQSPNDEASCQVKLTGSVASSGDVFMPEEEKVLIVGDDELVPHGLHTIMKRMKKGEHTQFRIKPNTEFHYDTAYQALPDGVSADDELLFDVEMLDFTRAKETWAMDVSEKIESATKTKNKGNEFFKAKRMMDASKKYEKVLSTLEHVADASEEEQKEVNNLLIAAYNNLAILQLNDKNYETAVSNTTKALKLDPNNTKSLFRRSKAHMATGEIQACARDIKQALASDKENKLFLAQHRAVKQRINAERKKQKAIYSKMFAAPTKKVEES